MFVELTAAVPELQARGLYKSASWCSELAISGRVPEDDSALLMKEGLFNIQSAALPKSFELANGRKMTRLVFNTIQTAKIFFDQRQYMRAFHLLDQ